MTAFIEVLLQISLSTAVIIGVLLLLTPLWQRRYSAQWRKVIWLVIAVRLLIPVSLELPQTTVQLNMDLQAAPVIVNPGQIETASEPVDTMPMTNAVSVTSETVQMEHASTATITPVRQSISRGTVLFTIWLLGAVCFLLWHGVQYGLFRRKALRTAQPLEDSGDVLQQAAEGLRLRRMPSVWISAAVQGPMLLGFRTPMILLPQRLYGQQELTLILRHELTHYKLHDLWYKLVLLLANAVHWLNPLVWLMVWQAGRDVEQVCDAHVVQGQDLHYRKAYSMTILNAMGTQSGVALSTYLSKQAQNGKKRLTDILYPRQMKKGVAALLTVVLLAVVASGCLQVGKVDDAMTAYKQVANFLPEQAIQEPTVYEVQDDEATGMIMYLWIEEPDQPLEDGVGDYVIRWTDDDGKQYLPQRALTVTVSKADQRVVHYQYQRNEQDSAVPEQPTMLAQSAEQRKDYLQQAARKLLADGATLDFTEMRTTQDEQGRVCKAYFTCGTMADAQWYSATLNCQYGYLESLTCWEETMLTQASAVKREVTFFLEGMKETMTLGMNRQPGYYVMFTDAEWLSSQLSGIGQDGTFCDRYVYRGEDSPMQSYLQVGFVPGVTDTQWLITLEPDSRYAPQSPLSYLLAWQAEDATIHFSDDPTRSWKVFTANSDTVVNRCYITPYRDGYMVAQLSCPVEYEEGLGVRMQAMLDTLVLASNEKATVSDRVATVREQVGPWLPEDLELEDMPYQAGVSENGENWIRWRSADYEAAIPNAWVGVTCDKDGAIVSMEQSTQALPLEQPLTERQARTLAGDCLRAWSGERATLIAWQSDALDTRNRAERLADGEYGWTAASKKENIYYDIVVNGQYGYVKQYQRYYSDAQLQQQVLNWLAVEETRLYSDYYDIQFFTPVVTGESREQKTYSVTLLHTMTYRNKGDKDSNTYLNELKAAGSSDYSRMYEAYDQLQESTLCVKVEADILQDGTLDMAHCRLFQEPAAADYNTWEELPGLYVFLRDGKAEVAGWNKHKTQVLWAADCYLQAYLANDAATLRRFSTIKPLKTPEVTVTRRVEQQLRNQLLQSFLQQYGGQTAVTDNTIVQVYCNREALGYTLDGGLYLTLQKVDGQWKVTAADVKVSATDLYERVAPWLPEGAVENPEQYDTRKLQYQSATNYIWGQDVMAMALSSQYPPPTDAPTGLTIRADDATGDILFFRYWYDREAVTLPTITPSFYEDKAAGEAYLRQFAEAFLPDGVALSFHREADRPAWQQYVAMDEKRHCKYMIQLDAEHGYVFDFHKEYYNTALRQQAYNWLQAQYRAKLGERYVLTPDVVMVEGESQNLKENTYTWRTFHKLYWRPIMTEAFQRQLEQLKGLDKAQYQLVADTFRLMYPYLSDVSIQGRLNWRGKLKSSSMELFTGSADVTEPWTKADWQQLDDTLQIIWTAAGYANAWAHHYPEAMALYGETDGVAFSDYTYVDSYLTLVEGCRSTVSHYAGGDTCRIELGMHTADERLQYLQMDLQKENGQWRVMQAELKRG